MNINLLLNSQFNFTYLNILNEFYNFNDASKNTHKSIKKNMENLNFNEVSKNTNKSIKKSLENLNFDSIIYFFSYDENIIQNKFFPVNNKDNDDNNNNNPSYTDLVNYYNYIIILEYLNIFVNSKVIFYYDKKYEHKLSYTKKILTFISKNYKHFKNYNEIFDYDYLNPFNDSENEYYINSEFTEIYYTKLNEFKKYFNKNGKIKINNNINEFDRIEFKKIPDIPITNEFDFSYFKKNLYYKFYLLKILTDENKNIPIINIRLPIKNFYNIDYNLKNILNDNYNLIYLKKYGGIFNFKNMKNIEDILNYIIKFKEENLTFKKIFKKFFDEDEDEDDKSIKKYNLKN